MWKEKQVINYIFLCHPNFWGMRFVMKYFKNHNVKIDESTLRKKCQSKSFKSYKQGGKWFISREQIIAEMLRLKKAKTPRPSSGEIYGLR